MHQNVFTFIKAYIYIWLNIVNELLPYTTTTFYRRKVKRTLYSMVYINHKYWFNKQISTDKRTRSLLPRVEESLWPSRLLRRVELEKKPYLKLHKPFQLLLGTRFKSLNSIMLTGWFWAGPTLRVHTGPFSSMTWK